MDLDRRFLLFAAPLALIAGACASEPVATAQRPVTAAPLVPPVSNAVSHGLTFARTHCAACHAIAPNQLSPKPEAPAFEAVVGTSGLTPETLAAWLRASHNFPDVMNFAIDPVEIDALAAYMMTLREGK